MLKNIKTKEVKRRLEISDKDLQFISGNLKLYVRQQLISEGFDLNMKIDIEYSNERCATTYTQTIIRRINFLPKKRRKVLKYE